MFTAGALSRAKHFQILSLISSNFGDTGFFSQLKILSLAKHFQIVVFLN